MSAVEGIENLVLGGGEAGKYVAWELAKQGRSTMVIERALVGGSRVESQGPVRPLHGAGTRTLEYETVFVTAQGERVPEEAADPRVVPIRDQL